MSYIGFSSFRKLYKQETIKVKFRLVDHTRAELTQFYMAQRRILPYSKALEELMNFFSGSSIDKHCLFCMKLSVNLEFRMSDENFLFLVALAVAVFLFLQSPWPFSSLIPLQYYWPQFVFPGNQ